MKLQKYISKFSIALLALLTILSIAIPAFAPIAFAAPDPNISPYKLAQVWNAGLALANCSKDAGWDQTQTGDDINKGAIFDAAGPTKVPGYTVDPSQDGEVQCEDDADAKLLFDALDVSPLKFLRDAGIYKINDSNSAYDVQMNSNEERAAAIKQHVEELFGFTYGSRLPDASQYATLRATFDKECRGSRDDAADKVKIVDSKTGKIEEKGYAIKNTSASYGVGYSLDADGGNDQKMACPTIVSQMGLMAQAYSDRVKAIGGETDSSDSGDSTKTAPSCESESGVMSWVMCPVANMIELASGWVDNQIQALMEVDSNYYSNKELKESFGKIRNLAYIILVPIVLVMVIATAMGFDFVSAYTVKRALPRLFVAVIFIALSYNICVFAIQFFNELGSAVVGIMTQPFGGIDNIALTDLFSGNVFTGLVTGAASAVGLILVFWLFGGTLLLFALLAFAVLMLRQMVIIVLMLMAPLAILAWIFPGNDRFWKIWWLSFVKLMLMYPLVMALMAAGRIFAVVIDAADEGFFAKLMTMAAVLLPYAFIPFTFKFAGGLFATMTGMMQDKSKGLFDRQRKSRAGKIERTARGNMFKNASDRGLRGRMNTIGAGVMNVNKAGLRPSKWRTNMSSALAGNAMLEASESSDKNESYQSWKGDDDLNRAALTASLEGRDIRDVLRERGYAGHGDANVDQAQARRAIDMAASRVERTRKEVSEKAFQQMTWLSAMKGGTAYDYTDGSSGAEAWRDAGRVAGDDDAVLATLVAKGREAAMSAGRIDQGGAGFGATFTAAQAMRDGRLSEDQAAAQVHRGVVESQGPGVLAHASMKPRSIQQLVPELRERLIEAEAQGGDAYDRELAMVASVYDSMAASSPQNARILADEVLRWDPSRGAAHQPLAPGVAGPVLDADSLSQGLAQQPLAPGVAGPVLPTAPRTVQQIIEARRNSEVFQSTRRELNASQARMGQVGGGAVGNQPAGGGPAGPPAAP